jgi:hypothetical protein
MALAVGDLPVCRFVIAQPRAGGGKATGYTVRLSAAVMFS